MDTDTVIFTIVTKSHLPRARVLMDSVKKFELKARRVCVLADRIDGYFNREEESFEILEAEDLSIPSFRNMAFRYSPLEFCCALKPFIAQFFLNKGYQELVYFDSDCLVMRELHELQLLHKKHDIILTPHMCSPTTDRCRWTDEQPFLITGIYNAGFFSVRNSQESKRFLKWWARNVQTKCRINIPFGLYLDQRWLDLAPALFTGVHVLRDSRFNLACWNILERHIELDKDGQWLVDGKPLVFFHFANFDPYESEYFENHSPLPANQNLDVILKKLAEEYKTHLLNAGFAEMQKLPYTYDYFKTGELIPNFVHKFFQERFDPAGDWLHDAFDPHARQSVIEPLNCAREDTALTLAAILFRENKPSLMAKFPNIPGVDEMLYANYLLNEEVKQDFPSLFSDTIRCVLKKNKRKYQIMRFFRQITHWLGIIHFVPGPLRRKLFSRLAKVPHSESN